MPIKVYKPTSAGRRGYVSVMTDDITTAEPYRPLLTDKRKRAGRNRWKGKRPSVRGSAMNPVDHPHGGGEGKSKGGRHPVTPWGVPTLGKRTRSKHKESDKLIVRGRRRGKDTRR